MADDGFRLKVKTNGCHTIGIQIGLIVDQPNMHDEIWFFCFLGIPIADNPKKTNKYNVFSHSCFKDCVSHKFLDGWGLYTISQGSKNLPLKFP